MTNEPLFHEIYGTYFAITRKILSSPQPLTNKELEHIVRQQGFAESFIQLLPSLQNKNNSWYLLHEKAGAWKPITQQAPPLVHTSLERRWLKTMLTDPRIAFFLEESARLDLEKQLKIVEPLFDLEAVTYYDQFNQVNSLVNQEQQQAHFKQLLAAIQAQSMLEITYQRHSKSSSTTNIFLPIQLEYSAKNNLFRLKAWKILRKNRFEVTLNLNRMLTIHSIERKQHYMHLPITSQKKQIQMTCLLVNERQALKRSMLHFADYHKTTRRLENKYYELTIYYDPEVETELVIRLLSFGPFLKVTSPETFVAKIKERIDAQKQWLANLE